LKITEKCCHPVKEAKIFEHNIVGGRFTEPTVIPYTHTHTVKQWYHIY